MSLTPTQSMSAPAACAARKRFLPIRPNPLIPACTAIGSSFRVSPRLGPERTDVGDFGTLIAFACLPCTNRMLGGTMKRLFTLMLACAAIIVFAIAATGVRAEDGSDDNTGTQTAQPCDNPQGEHEGGDDHGTDSRAIASDDREGTSGDDDQDGTRGDDQLNGRAGDDDERGDAGDDEINGDSGDDDLCGDAGDDDMDGGPGDDIMKGGGGNVRMVGGKGHDDIEGNAGNDTINSRDGQRDVVNCGRGHDHVRADRKDHVSRTCESVKRS